MYLFKPKTITVDSYSVDPSNMFNGYLNTQTSDTDEVWVIVAAKKISHFALFELDAYQVDWELQTAGRVVIKSGTIDLELDNPVGLVTHKSDVIQEVGAWVYNGFLKVTIKKTGSTAKCGHMVVGKSYNAGTTVLGADTDLLDYSQYDTDDYGITTLTPGNWAKSNTITSRIPLSQVDDVFKIICDVRAIQAVWEFNGTQSDYEPMTMLGWYSKAEFKLDYRFGYLDLKVKGAV
jgi:hypothetical protein